jgi:hypothetical protein
MLVNGQTGASGTQSGSGAMAAFAAMATRPAPGRRTNVDPSRAWLQPFIQVRRWWWSRWW